MLKSWMIVLPILNRSIVLFRGPTCSLGKGVYLQTVTDDIYRALHDASNEYAASIKTSTKCVCITTSEQKPAAWTDYARNHARIVKTALNMLSAGNPVILASAAIVSRTRQSKVERIIATDAIADVHRFREKVFRLKPNMTKEVLAETYRIIDLVCARPQVFVTFDKFNSSLTRASWEDKIIDTTISLESLIQGTTELRFRFSLYLSYIVANTPEMRQKAFNLFQDLYDTRSKLVHGGASSSIVQKLTQNWEDISCMARAAINYYAFFLCFKQLDWEEHLKRLVFGIDQRIIDN